MTQLLNNMWCALSTENPELIKILQIPLGIIENYLSMKIFLTIFNINASKKQVSWYIILTLIVSMLSSNFILAPFNVIVNYTCIIIFIKLIFGLNILKCFLSLIASSFTFGLINILLQKPYITLLNINTDTVAHIPIYKFSFLILVYVSVFIILIFLKKFKNIKLSLDLFDTLDKKTLRILYVNLFIGFLTLGLQLIITAFYVDIVPYIITLLSFILLIAFLVLSIYSFTRMIKLANTRRDLECAEEYNKSLEILYDKVKGFKHDFDNIVSTLDGYIETNDMPGLKKYFNEVKKDCKITNNLSIINPRTINNPGIYSLLNNKYFKASNLGINFEFEYFINLNKLDINLYQFSRILGILIDNAIEEAEKCNDKVVKLSFIRENRNNRTLITIQNTYSNKDVDIEKIFNKGESGKSNHSGIGLWEVKNYVKKSKNLDLFTTKDDKFFKQELSIYDLQE